MTASSNSKPCIWSVNIYYIPDVYKTVVGTVDIIMSKTNDVGTSLVAHWLRMRTPNAGGLGLIPGRGAGSHMPKLRERMWQQTPKVLSATSKTWRGQINTLKKKSDKEHCPHDSRQRDRYWWNIKNVTTQINAKLQLWLTSRREVHGALRIYDWWKWSSLGKIQF